MLPCNPEPPANRFTGYAEALVAQALREGCVVAPVLLECLYYATEPDLLAAIRAVAALDTGARLVVMAYARRLAEEARPVVVESGPRT